MELDVEKVEQGITKEVKESRARVDELDIEIQQIGVAQTDFENSMRHIEGELKAKLENLDSISRQLAAEERDYDVRK